MNKYLIDFISVFSNSNIIYYIMFFILLIGLYYCLKLSLLKLSFISATKKLRKLTQEDNPLKSYLCKTTETPYKLFGYKALQQRFVDYRNSIGNNKETTETSYPNISHYINADLIDKITNIEFCELISSLMTGIGIFGTFAGLIIGVKKIDIQTTETLGQGITGLLGGISYAFLTSISGVFCSVLFSIIYKPLYASCIESMNSFLELFHSLNYDFSENQKVNQLLIYQQKQTEALENFAQTVGKAICDNIAQILSPVIAKMEKSIEDFSKLAAKEQQEGLDKIVKQFIETMNESLKGQFKELGNTIKDLCEWQRSSVIQMQKIVDGICETSTEIEKINEISQNTIKEMNNFVIKISSMQDSINQGMELARQHIEQGNAISERNSAYIERIVECESRITSIAGTVKSQAESAKLIANELFESCKQHVNDLNNLSKESLTDITKATNVVVETAHAELSQISSSAQDEIQALSEASQRLAEENSKQLEALTTTSNKQIQLIANNSQEILNQNKNLITEFSDKLQTQYDDLYNATSDFASFIKDQNQEILDNVTNSVNTITVAANNNANALNNATNGIKNATDAMISASETLDSNMESALTNTFNTFDSGLSEICQHLSGTIADTRDTLESLPQLIQHSQKIYEKTLKDLADNTQQYCESVNSLKNRIDALTTNNGR